MEKNKNNNIKKVKKSRNDIFRMNILLIYPHFFFNQTISLP